MFPAHITLPLAMPVLSKSSKTAVKAAKASATTLLPERCETHDSVVAMKHSILRHLTYTQARDQGTATVRDWWLATSMAVRDRLLKRLIETQAIHNKQNARRLYYLSL